VQSTRQWNKELDLLVDTLGIAGEEAARLNFIGRTVGLTAQDTAGSFGLLSRKLAEQQKQIREGTSDFDKWGVRVTDSAGRILAFEEILGNVNETVGRMPSGLAKTAALMDLFGRSGKEMHDLVSLTRGEIAGMVDDVDKLGLSMSTGGVAAAEQFERQFNRLGLTVDAFKITIGNALLPLLSNMIARFVTWAKDVLPRLREQLGPIVSAIGQLAMAVFNLFTSLGRVIGALLRVITGQREAASVAKVFGEALRRVASFLKEVADAADRFAQLVGEKGVIGALKQLGGDLLGSIARFLGDIGEKLDELTGKAEPLNLALKATGVALGLIVAEHIIQGIGKLGLAFLNLDLIMRGLVLFGFALAIVEITTRLDELPTAIQKVNLLFGLAGFAVLGFAAAFGAIPLAVAAAGVAIGLLVSRIIENWDDISAKTEEAAAWWGMQFSNFGAHVKGVFDDIGRWWDQVVFDMSVKLNQLILDFNKLPLPDIATIGTGRSSTAQRDSLDAQRRQQIEDRGFTGQAASSQDRPATLDDVYAAFTRNHGTMPDYSWAAQILAMGPMWSEVQGLAKGGIVTQPIIRRIGEEGPEAVIPLDRARGMGTTVINHITVTGNVGMNERELARMVGDVILQDVSRIRATGY
jgi:hypothetical protein